MRRLLGIVLLLLFSLPLIAPAFGLDVSGPGSGLPACCRRNGTHHCMGNMEQGGAGSSGIRIAPKPKRCPAWPAVITQVSHGDLCLRAASLIFAEIVSHPSVHIQSEARARVALDRSRHKRGPPSLYLL